MVEYKNELYQVANERFCGGVDLYQNGIVKHIHIHSNFLNKTNKYIMIEKENLIKCYKNYPEFRAFLLDLVPGFLPEKELELIEKTDRIEKLEKELENCKK